MNNNKNNNIKKNYNLYNGFIFDYSKKYKEPDFLSPILIENHSFYCSGGLFLDYENKEIIKSKNYSFKDEFPNNFDEIKNNFKEIFEELKVDPSNHYVILTDSLINFNNKNKEYKKKMSQIMFETFKVKGLYFLKNQILASYCNNRKSTKIIINLGENGTDFIPFFEGYPLPHAYKHLNLGGKEVTEYLMKLLSKSGDIYYKTINYKIAKDIKEKACYYSNNFNKKFYDYELPDYSHIILSNERTKVIDALFPNLIGKQGIIAQTCIDSIESCDNDIQKKLYKNIVLYGRNTKIYGFISRLNNEMSHLCNKNFRIYNCNNYYNDDNLKYYVLYLLYKSENLRNDFINKDEYEKQGATIVYRKFFF